MKPKRTKLHEMGLRGGEQYKVKYAKTERLRKLSIPFMQRLLNKECTKQHTSLPYHTHSTNHTAILYHTVIPYHTAIPY